jgi:hypothetical protein
MQPFARRLAAAVAQVGFAALLSLALPACAAEPATRTIAWDDLRPAPIEAAADPFADMPDEQLDMLRVLLRSRVLEARGFTVTEDARRMRDELARKLALQGVDVDAVLAKRDAVIAARRRAAEAGLPALDGRKVELAGYLLPVAALDPRRPEYVLVPAPGACSHALPPPPNQIVRVRPSKPIAIAGFYAAATVAGTMRQRLESGSVNVVDGERVLASAYAIDDADVVPRDR